MFLIILLLFVDVTYGISVNEAFRIAGCLANCQKESCYDDCKTNSHLSLDLKKVATSANFNATLLCKDIDLLTLIHHPGLFVIEQVTFNDSWSDAIISNGSTTSFFHLQSGVQYRYRAHRITNEGISKPEFTPWFVTTEMGIQPKPVRNVVIKNIAPESGDSQYLQADIIFEPAEDQCCLYNILSWSADEGLSQYIHNANMSTNFRFRLHSLNYHQNTTIIIAAKNRGSSQNSKNISLSFVTPSCLDIWKNSTICPPNKVTGLRLVQVESQELTYNFVIAWDKPSFSPDNYTIQILLLGEVEEQHTFSVLGNLTEVQHSVKKFGLPYVISIVAESPGGKSPPVSIYGKLNFDSSNSSNAIDQTVIITSLSLIFIISSVIIYGLYRRKNIKRSKGQYKYCVNLAKGSSLSPLYEKSLKPTTDLENKSDDTRLIQKDDFEIRPTQLCVKEILGSGMSGVVRLGSLQINANKSIDVAVKMLRDHPSPDELRNFQQEISIMKSAGTHPNIVSIIGCCTLDIRPILIVEYCCRGDLQSYLRHIWKTIVMNAADCQNQCKISSKMEHGSLKYSSLIFGDQEAVSNQLYDIEQELLTSTDEITAVDLLNFARQVANGMEFLSLNRIVHRDLAARNVLVCADRTIKISDFGLSRDIYRQNVYKKQGDGKLPLKWMALEALTHQIYTSQSDVWAFGILLWEIVTLGCNPYPEIPTNMILQHLKSGYRMPRPSNCRKELYDIMIACWHSSPRSRPTFTELKKNLDNLLQTTTNHEYLNLYELRQEYKKI